MEPSPTKKKCYRFHKIKKPLGELPLRRTRRWKDNIKNLGKECCDDG
jgi:hypothetical protein